MTEDIKFNRILLGNFLVFHYFTLALFYQSHLLLSQFQPVMLLHNHDLGELAVIATGLPRYMISHPSTFWIADGWLWLVPLPVLFLFYRKKRFYFFPGVLLPISWGLYLILQNIFTEQHPETYMGLLTMSCCFLAASQRFINLVLAGSRYLFLYIFASAALWKLARGSAFFPDEFSNILITQHADVLAGSQEVGNRGILFFLVNHPGWSYTLYLAAILLELTFLVGFFTYRFDSLLLLLSLVFFLADDWLMRIPFWSALVCGITLTPFVRNRIAGIRLFRGGLPRDRTT